MSDLDCFNLCEESCVKCKMLKPDSKYCRYCDICKKECKSYINKNLDISNSEKSNNEISNNDLSFNDISDVVGLKNILLIINIYTLFYTNSNISNTSYIFII